LRVEKKGLRGIGYFGCQHEGEKGAGGKHSKGNGNYLDNRY